MTQHFKHFSLSACALAVSLLLSACGGAESTDTVAPTVAITDNVAGTTASGAVTFSFTFSEDVGSSFVAEDITVTGGTAGALTKVDAMHYTLVVTPAASATGTISVAVAAQRFTDPALNGNAEAASAQQAYDTTTAAPTSGNTGTCTVAPCIDFADAGVGYDAFEGLVSSAQATDPVDAANKVAKFVKGPGSTIQPGQPWAGATIYTSSSDKSVQAFDLAASKVVTLRVYAPSAGMKMTLKLENAANAGINMLKTVTTTQANAWETLTFDFASPTQGAFNPAETYNKVSIFPVFDPTVQNPTAPASDTTFYFDELKYTAVGGGGGGGGGAGGGGSGAATFSAGFSSNGLTANGGAFGGFSGSNQDNFSCSGDPAFCGAGGDFTGGTGSYYFYYYQTPTPATQMYVGMYVLAPGVTAFNNAGDTAGVSVGSRPNLKFTFNQNSEWFNSATNNFMIVVDLGKRYVAGGNTCRLQLRNVTTPTAATATAYTIPWTAFDLVQNCGQSLTVAQALAASPVSQISFQGVGNADRLPAGGKLSGANTSGAVNGVYPSTVVVSGAITFE